MRTTVRVILRLQSLQTAGVESAYGLVGLKANPVFRSEKGVAILGPRYFKFDFDYVPIEETLGK